MTDEEAKYVIQKAWYDTSEALDKLRGVDAFVGNFRFPTRGEVNPRIMEAYDEIIETDQFKNCEKVLNDLSNQLLCCYKRFREES